MLTTMMEENWAIGYPPIAAQLAELMARIEASDQQIERINARALPAGAKRLLEAELVARGLPGFVDSGSSVPLIIGDLRLPAFEYSRYDLYTWSRERARLAIRLNAAAIAPLRWR
jgi:hypothetical protein